MRSAEAGPEPQVAQPFDPSRVKKQHQRYFRPQTDAAPVSAPRAQPSADRRYFGPEHGVTTKYHSSPSIDLYGPSSPQPPSVYYEPSSLSTTKTYPDPAPPPPAPETYSLTSQRYPSSYPTYQASTALPPVQIVTAPTPKPIYRDQADHFRPGLVLTENNPQVTQPYLVSTKNSDSRHLTQTNDLKDGSGQQTQKAKLSWSGLPQVPSSTNLNELNWPDHISRPSKSNKLITTLLNI